jgi:hypothetical protein
VFRQDVKLAENWAVSYLPSPLRRRPADLVTLDGHGSPRGLVRMWAADVMPSEMQLEWAVNARDNDV